MKSDNPFKVIFPWDDKELNLDDLIKPINEANKLAKEFSPFWGRISVAPIVNYLFSGNPVVYEVDLDTNDTYVGRERRSKVRKVVSGSYTRVMSAIQRVTMPKTLKIRRIS